MDFRPNRVGIYFVGGNRPPFISNRINICIFVPYFDIILLAIHIFYNRSIHYIYYGIKCYLLSKLDKRSDSFLSWDKELHAGLIHLLFLWCFSSLLNVSQGSSMLMGREIQLNLLDPINIRCIKSAHFSALVAKQKIKTLQIYVKKMIFRLLPLRF